MSLKTKGQLETFFLIQTRLMYTVRLVCCKNQNWFAHSCSQPTGLQRGPWKESLQLWHIHGSLSPLYNSEWQGRVTGLPHAQDSHGAPRSIKPDRWLSLPSKSMKVKEWVKGFGSPRNGPFLHKQGPVEGFYSMSNESQSAPGTTLKVYPGSLV